MQYNKVKDAFYNHLVSLHGAGLIVKDREYLSEGLEFFFQLPECIDLLADDDLSDKKVYDECYATLCESKLVKILPISVEGINAVRDLYSITER